MSIVSREASADAKTPRNGSGADFGSVRQRRIPVRVLIFLTDGISIEGYVHIQPYSRVLDLINNPDGDFMAVTEARLTETGRDPEDMPFLAVRKSMISRVCELPEPSGRD